MNLVYILINIILYLVLLIAINHIQNQGSLSVGHSRRHVGGPTNWDIA